MNLLIHIATPHSRGVLDHLARACARSGIKWACFLTNDGVKLLEVQPIQQALSAADALIVCKHAWNLHLPGKECLRNSAANLTTVTLWDAVEK